MRRFIQFILLLAVLGSLETGHSPDVSLPLSLPIRQASAHNQPNPRELSARISEKLGEVDEFRVIRKAADELGLRVWLFGGTAAGFGHYVRWDMAREAGDTRYPKSRFDYDFTSIYRSTQDADLVVDGDVRKVQKLEHLIRERLSHLQGAKDEWEVRLLRADRDGKQALLDNPDFLNQHTDSNSTGMIELSTPPRGESRVRDLRDWGNNEAPRFLVDLLEGKLHYYFSAKHEETSLYKQGLNPPIFSVIRYFTKAFQYDLQLRAEDLEILKKLVAEFDAARDLAVPKAESRFEKIGSRLILHASNIEYAWDTLEALGLRQILISASKRPSYDKKLTYWLQKEPLRTKPVGTGPGRTLRQVLAARGLKDADAVFAHETSDFLAWESITRDATGRPNVLVSRKNVPGEVAAHGDGHYTKLGHYGAKGTGFTIRYQARLDAREGTDFTHHGDIFVWRNRACLRIIPESLEITALKYFQMIYEGRGFDVSDRGINEKIRKRVHQSLPSPEEKALLLAIIQNEIKKVLKDESVDDFSPLLQEWFAMPLSADYPSLAALLIYSPESRFNHDIHEHIFAHPHWARYPDLVEAMIARGSNHRWMAKYVLSKRHWKSQVFWARRVIDSEIEPRTITRYILSHEHWSDHPEFVDLLLDRGKSIPGSLPTIDRELVEHVLSKPYWPHRPEILLGIMERGFANEELVQHVLSQEHMAGHVEYVELLLELNDFKVDLAIAQHYLAKPFSAAHPGIFRTILHRVRASNEEYSKIRGALISSALTKAHWAPHPEFIESLLEDKANFRMIAQLLLPQIHWEPYRLGWFKKMMKPGTVDEDLIHALNQPSWSPQPELFKSLILRIQDPTQRDHHGLDNPKWKGNPELIEAYLKHPRVVSHLVNELLMHEHWRTDPRLRQLCGGQDPTFQALQAALKNQSLPSAGKDCDELLNPRERKNQDDYPRS